MRVSFAPPSVRDFEQLFLPSQGGGLNNIRIYSPYSRGGGILSFLAGLAKKALPFLFNTVAPEGLAMANQVMQDVSSGNKTIKQALKTRGIESLRNVGSKLAKGGRKIKRLLKKKKKKNSNNNKKKKTKCFNDVFSSI